MGPADGIGPATSPWRVCAAPSCVATSSAQVHLARLTCSDSTHGAAREPGRFGSQFPRSVSRLSQQSPSILR